MANPELVQQAIARNVRLFRTRRALSLDDLAARSAVSRAMIVQIEQGRTNPSIATLCRLAEALGETVAALIDLSDTSSARVIRAEEAADLWRGKRGSRARVLAGAGDSSRVELWEWHLKYGDPYEAPAHTRGTRELIYVVAGILLLTISEEKIRGEAGETVIFHANRPHRYAAADRDGCHLIMVVLEAPAEKG